MISTILATDMAKHFPMITAMNARFDDMAEAAIGSRETDKDAIGDFLIHSADLSNPTKTYDILYNWSK
jgi:hypothetical protein